MQNCFIKNAVAIDENERLSQWIKSGKYGGRGQDFSFKLPKWCLVWHLLLLKRHYRTESFITVLYPFFAHKLIQIYHLKNNIKPFI